MFTVGNGWKYVVGCPCLSHTRKRLARITRGCPSTSRTASRCEGGDSRRAILGLWEASGRGLTSLRYSAILSLSGGTRTSREAKRTLTTKETKDRPSPPSEGAKVEASTPSTSRSKKEASSHLEEERKGTGRPLDRPSRKFPDLPRGGQPQREGEAMTQTETETKEEREEREAIEAKRTLDLQVREGLRFLASQDRDEAKAIARGFNLRKKEDPRREDTLLREVVEEVIRSLAPKKRSSRDEGKRALTNPLTAAGTFLDRSFPAIVRRLMRLRGLDLGLDDSGRAGEYTRAMRSLIRIINTSAGKKLVTQNTSKNEGVKVPWPVWEALLTQTPFGEPLGEAVYHLLLWRRATRIANTPNLPHKVRWEAEVEAGTQGRFALRWLRLFAEDAGLMFQWFLPEAEAIAARPPKAEVPRERQKVEVRVSRDGGESWTTEYVEPARWKRGGREVHFGVSEEALERALGARRWAMLEEEGLGMFV